MAIKPIDYDALRENIDEMINLMEYDSMRSAGKCKVNAQLLVALKELQREYAVPVKQTIRKEVSK